MEFMNSLLQMINPFLIIYILLVVSIIVNLTLLFNIIKNIKKQKIYKEHINTLRTLNDNVRGFKHDFNNMISTICGYVFADDLPNLKKYCTQLEKECCEVNTLSNLSPNIVNDYGVYNLITKKFSEARTKDIFFDITFLLDFSKLNIKMYEFTRILGILLDNAIEASSECDFKIINLIFRDDVKNSRHVITIENTYSNKNIDTDKIFEKGFSGKAEHSGIGLWQVRKIINKYFNVNLFTSKNDTFFTQQLEIYY